MADGDGATLVRYYLKSQSPGHPGEFHVADEDQGHRIVAHVRLYLEDMITEPEHGDESALVAKVTWVPE